MSSTSDVWEVEKSGFDEAGYLRDLLYECWKIEVGFEFGDILRFTYAITWRRVS